MKRHHWMFWTLQAVLLVVVAVFMWRAVVDNLDQLRASTITWEVRPMWLVLAVVVVLLTYVLLIETWRMVLRGWGQVLPFREAARIWTLANLGRYIPGKVWAVAGLVVLAQRSGVAGWAAAGSAVVVQGIALGTGAAVVVAMLPGDVHVGWIAAAVVLAVVTYVVPIWPWAVRRISGLVAQEGLVPLRWPAVLGAVGAATIAWVGYGVAFWCLLHGLVAVPMPVTLAIGAFAAGYIIGFLAAFAPGGIGVREGVIGPLIVGSVGAGPALVAVAAQRILFTLTEGLAALVGFALGGLGRTDGLD